MAYSGQSVHATMRLGTDASQSRHVCRTWLRMTPDDVRVPVRQQALEKVNFYKLKLGVSCLDDFESFISPRKRDIIHHICLNIELARYSSLCCSKRRSPIVSDGIWRLLSILSTWKPATHLALEINVYSPSDCEHYFKNLFLSTDDVEHDRGVTPDAWRAMNLHHDPRHGWIHGKPVEVAPCHTVKKLTIFEDDHENYGLFLDPPVWIDYNDPSKRLDAVLASKSLNLEHFAISFKVNAEDIFRYCNPTWSWSNLQSLALTSPLLQNDEGGSNQIEGLLCQASALAQKMPKLHTFVLWNGGKEHACAFIYRVGRDYATVIWRGTWRLELSPRVVESWQLVASKLCDKKFQVRQEFVQGDMKLHGDAIYHLDLPCQVVDPASLWQIRREAWSLEG
ncbi:hypothetical protein LX32DRAFT_665009 [Colletotrichum zoysiae]|uniref:DUF6546 domain-containing protein n=1 Tax=Colletotrichum zoysiae TaxID=1216348 RepID=A0AAD9HFE1_9PEZI|nr:hypothetical protein LX32DRAFT_665009 [Colletotrichum zoysiae]